MKIEQLYTGCLAEAAYYIESEGEAAIIDPLRETQPYTDLAQKNNSKIKYIFETHFHADFVSGHIDLAKKTGATIVFGPNASAGYDVHIATDGEQFKIGKIIIIAMHTPGHTLESTTWLLRDENGKDTAIFTGDTLFIGDVGRPDLAIKSDLTQEDLAGMLYDSLRNKIMPLSNDVIVYPGHGAGSACGKNMSSETFATLGNQKEKNYALGNISRDEFIRELTTGIMPAPQYFAKDAMLNKMGYDSIDEVLTRGVKPLTLDEFAQEIANGALILDTRNKTLFAEEFIPGSLFIGLDGQFAVWAGALITDQKQPIVLVCEEGKEEEAVLRLARVGYDNTKGFLKGGFATWKNSGKATDKIQNISATALAEKMKNEKLSIVDTRKPGEYNAGHVEEATSYPLDFINQHLNDLDKSKTHYLHCKSGYRSLIATSILKRNGYKNVIDVLGGYTDIEKTSIPKTCAVCAS